MSQIIDDPSARESGGKDIATLVYILQALAIINGLTAIAGVIVNYLKYDDVRDTWLESHFRWQMRTFWFTLIWALVGIALSLILIGYVILFALTIWFIYRVVRGWMLLYERRPVEPLQTLP